MSQYTPVTNFLSKDSLVSGNPLKAVKGADLSTEFAAVQTAVNSKVDGVVEFFPDGSAVQPSVGFVNNAGTGMYNAAGVLGFATNGLQRVSVSVNGNVVVAAPTSGVPLTLPSTAAAIAMTGANLNIGLGSAFSGGETELYTTSTNRLGIGTAGAAVVNFYTNSVQAAFFDTSQNLNINNGAGGQSPVYAGIPQNAQNGNYTLVLADANKHIYVTTSGITFTIPANSSVAYPIGTAITLVNESAGNATLAITTDTLSWLKGGSNAGGTRTIATESSVTFLKVSATRWVLTGNGIS